MVSFVSAFTKHSFRLEYPGELIRKTEGMETEKNYADNVNSYMFFYNDIW